MATKKVSLATIADQIAKMDARMERGFAAVAGDIADIKHDMATRDQIIALHRQVNSIETELRGMKHTKLQSRAADLEVKVLGETRA